MSCGQALAERMRRAGFRVTPQRNVILETIAHMGGHLPAQEVYEVARQRLPGLNLATVYRTLDSLHQAGLVDQLATADEPVRYALHDVTDPHGHLVCRGCGQILDLDSAAIQRLTRSLERKHGFRIDSDHLTLSGLCRQCQTRRTLRH
jgi:Fe2+ or Zn2+ uptake regulation protein